MNEEPAFPGLHPSKECHYQDAGMSLRDYFAAKAMQGLIHHFDFGTPRWEPSEVAELAYEQADAMLESRNR